MTLSPRHIRLAAYQISRDLARLSGLPEPLLAELRHVLNRELAARARESGCTPKSPLRLENVKQRARRLGYSESAVRRSAHQTGGHKVGRDWIWIVEK